MSIPEFKPFPKMARLSREMIVTEKIDGTNASICITEDGGFFTGSRTRWITPKDDNYGFSKWAHEHKDELMTLGPGTHFGEWWGQGIQRNYRLTEKRFSLFNVSRWADDAARPGCCHVVPVLRLRGAARRNACTNPIRSRPEASAESERKNAEVRCN